MDLVEAAKHSLYSAERGDARAQNEIGYHLDRGLGMTQDSVSAARWYQHAANQGQPNAMHSLAGMYLSGRGVMRNVVLGYAWLELAVRHYTQSEPQLATAQSLRDRLKMRLPPMALERANAFVAAWRAQPQQATATGN